MPMDEKKKIIEENLVQKDQVLLLLAEAEAMKRMAFFGIMVATVATLLAAVIVPMTYSYAIYIQISLQEEVQFCSQKRGNLQAEFLQFIAYRKKRNSGYQFTIQVPPEGVSKASFSSSGARRARQNLAEYQGIQPQNAQDHNSQQYPAGYIPVQPALRPLEQQQPQQCCPCNVGPPGPEGKPGEDGHDGINGIPGQAGKPAPDLSANQHPVESCNRPCPEGPMGPAGMAGEKGQIGPKGKNGINGMDGIPGENGPPGLLGMAGMPGSAGQPGLKGTNGELAEGNPTPGPPGGAGPTGPPGPPGPNAEASPPKPGVPGPIGDQGPPGPAGNPGNPGQNGESGKKGDGGGCSHCPAPRTAPGY